MMFVLFIYLKTLAKYFKCFSSSKTAQIEVIKNPFQPYGLYIQGCPDCNKLDELIHLQF